MMKIRALSHEVASLRNVAETRRGSRAKAPDSFNQLQADKRMLETDYQLLKTRFEIAIREGNEFQ